MTNKELGDLKNHPKLFALASTFEEKVMAGQKFSNDEVTADTYLEIPGLGKIGIEVVREYDRFHDPAYRIDLYEKKDDEYVMVHRHKFGLLSALMTNLVAVVEQYIEKKKRQERNQKRRKYLKGEQIRSVDEMLKQELVYWRDKVTHRDWFSRWQLKMAAEAIERGVIFYAVRKEDDDE